MQINLRKLGLGLLALTAFLPAGAVASGGIIGGGGGTVNPDPISIYDVTHVIEQNHLDLRLLARGLSENHSVLQMNLTPADPKLYDGPTTLVDVIETARVEILSDKPCLSPTGEEVDGSAPGSFPNSICISAYRIAPKLNDETSRSQILALMLHEYSHLLGTDETEAEAFQRTVLHHMKQFTHSDAEIKLASVMNDLTEAESRLRNFLDAYKAGNFEKAGQNLSEANAHFRSNGQGTYLLAALDAKETSGFELQSYRLLAGLWAFDALSGAPDAAYSESLLDNAFAGGDSTTLADFHKRHFFNHETSNLFPQEVIRRPKTLDEIAALADTLLKYLYQVSHALWNLQSGGERSVIAGPDGFATPNPWQSMVGTYVISEVQCENHGVAMQPQPVGGGFEVMNTNGRLELKRFNTGGYFIVGELESGSTFWSYSSVVVSRTPNGGASVNGTNGSYFRDERRSYAFELNPVAGQDFEVAEVFTTWDRNLYAGHPIERSGTCRYKLVKK